MNLDPDIAAEAFRLGASGYVLRIRQPASLFYGIREVLRGRSYMTPLMTKGWWDPFIQNIERKNHNKLTLRQTEFLQLLAEGRSMKEAAFILNVTPRTVAFHKYTMMEHLRSGAVPS